MNPTNTVPERVALPSGGAILIDAADRADLLARGYAGSWFIVSAKRGQQTVKTIEPGTPRQIPLAHLILRPPPGEKVSHRDGDRLNLTRRNLVLMSQRGRELREARDAARGALNAEREALRQTARDAVAAQRAARSARAAERRAARAAHVAQHQAARHSGPPLPRGVHWTPTGYRGEVHRLGVKFIKRCRTVAEADAFVTDIRNQLAAAAASD